MSRRPLHWGRVRGARAWAALATATGLGSGLLPVAPGTWGSLAALPLVYWSADWNPLARAGLWLGLLLAGTWAAKVMDELMDSADNQNIVMDEWVGMGITAWTAGTNWRALAAAFVLFRLLDSLKPWPIRLLDSWSKKKAGEKTGAASAWWGGFGVMADDLLAGFQGLLAVIALQAAGLL